MGNVIRNNTSAGVWSYSAAPEVTSNLIHGNRYDGIYASSGLGSTYPKIVCNTICGDASSASTYRGIYCSSSSPTVMGNIVAYGYRGIYVNSGSPVLIRNDFFGNSADYYPASLPHSTDISADPLFAKRAAGDYHLTAGSPCVDAGTGASPDLPLFDVDREGRVFGRAVDIGADEFWPDVLSIRDIKRAADGAFVHGQGPVVTGAFDGSAYVESDNRASGIRVEKQSHGLSIGDRTSIAGVVGTSPNGERYIDARSVVSCGHGQIDAVAMNNAAVGGGVEGFQDGVWGWQTIFGENGKPKRVWAKEQGLNNIGLLIRTWGKVTPEEANGQEFCIDDGYGAPVRCILPDGAVASPSWRFVIVTGLVSCIRVGDELRRAILLRSLDDVQPVP